MSDSTDRHSPAAHDAITAELVACTLGQRHRLELRTDLPRLDADMAAAFRRLGERITKAMEAMTLRAR